MVPFFNILKKEKPFGERAAELELENLEFYYQNTGHVDKLLNHSYFILQGPKGSGKSAIARHINNSKAHNFFPVLYDEKFLTSLIHEIGEKNLSYQMVELLNEVFLIFHVVNSLGGDHSLFQNEEWEKMQSLLKEFSIRVTLDHTEKNRKFSIKLGKILQVLEAVSVDLETKSSPKKEKISIYKLQEILKEWCDLLGSMKIANNHVLIIDDLDQQYSHTDYSTYNSQLVSLLKAVTRINILNSKIKILVFLRDDIFNRLQDANMSRIASQSIKLTWGQKTEDVIKNFSKIVRRRIEKVYSMRVLKEEDGWKLYFSLANPNQLEVNAFSVGNFIGLTRWCPRDIVELINCYYKHLSIIPDKYSRDEFLDAVSRSERDYSTYLWQEIKDGSHVEIKTVIDWGIFERIVKSFKPQFTFLEWCRHCSKFSISEENASKILEIMYAHSMINMYSKDFGVKCYYRSHEGEFTITAESFQVHKGLRRYLGFIFDKHNSSNARNYSIPSKFKMSQKWPKK